MKRFPLHPTVAALALLASSAVDARQPNIIYINTDDWGIGKVPAYQMDSASEKIIKTPNIDRLKEDGMQFTNAYAGNAVCGPSRCSLITGKHPGHAVWRANRRTMPKELWPPSYPLLGEVARRAGYTTAGFGKLSPGGHSTPEEITGCGWDYWLGFLGHVDCRDYYANFIWENGQRIRLPKNTRAVLKGTSFKEKPIGSGVVGEGKGTFIEDLYTDKIIEFMTSNKDKPFFVYFASTVPHGGPPGGMRVPSLEGYDKVENLTVYEQVYCALMTRHDRNVGRIREAVKQLGLEKDTLIIWTSDNGDEDSYYKRTKTFDGNGPFRMMKRSLYEGGIRVPLIAYWPGTIKPGTTTDVQTTQRDVMPTLADAGGKPKTEEMDGISILPTLQGQPEQQAKRDYIYFEFYERGKQQSVRMGDWKAYRKGGWEGKIELYDLAKDREEQHDLAAQHPELVKRMAEIMRKEHSPSPIWNLDPEDEKD
ncbi:arylsulfatase [Verrucomicrobiaceae bacterium R5-34]|uniref:Arylsulfatase n=1 Tax=Oceaniferula flava TaxID=2800421 RepID=A0AAE2SEH1_9BACT|nr:arylsulfatase [Oceaniferula flavus]MBK1831260.1 arylsulfatase [Verrucomicrobiaceae bacterium R5-34]MBK1855429.1 arylsulfatase [Oceaniferula flavus]MBM1136735.1 arylsulfatase [Oceaniferula flavus]